MDFLRKLGPLPFASRLKRLSERLYRDGETIYAEQGVAFEPRWFQVTARLREAGGEALPITVIAGDLGVTHPAVIKTVGEMERAGLVVSERDRLDARKRCVRLTGEGARLVERLEPLWERFQRATVQLFREVDCDLVAVLDRLEGALDRRDFADRVTGVEIVDHAPGMARRFRELNYQWLEETFGIESWDRRLLNAAKKMILDRGGAILYAQDGERIVGCVALVRHSARRFELAKMAVEREERGKGIGRLLLRAAIDRARERGARKLVLQTHEIHEAAVHLYREHGFRRRAVRIPEATAVCRAAGGFGMELDLEDEGARR